MAKNNLRHTVAAIIGTVLLSAACLAGAVGPAQPGAGKAAVAVAARFVA